MNLYKTKTIDELVETSLKIKKYKTNLKFYSSVYDYILYHHLQLLKDILRSAENNPSKHDLIIISKLKDHISEDNKDSMQEILNIYNLRETDDPYRSTNQ